MPEPALLALADGTLLHGLAVGASGHAVGEVVFNTAMTGYQEILTDPSYCRQIVTLTYPHIGNVGCNAQDEESTQVHAAGLVIRDLPRIYSSWRASEPLDAYLRARNVMAIAGLDTRALTGRLRRGGAQAGCIVAGPQCDAEFAVSQARAFAGLTGMDLARVVSTDTVYEWTGGAWTPDGFAPSPPPRFRVVAYDFGIKRNILRCLTQVGCAVTVVPATTPAAEVFALQPDGVFLSNGPGDPQPCDYAITAIAEFLDRGLPLFGICLGHQLLALAGGARTIKMKFGHHGANHPVLETASGRVLITSQNHGFAVDEASLPAGLTVTHRSLFDGSLQGIAHADKPAFGFQGHPEASPGPRDAAHLFERFAELMAARLG
ncbi:MAG: glutamine-hydrolyzing carbamoyl-phosphate synthase small subunit [Immundisolibacter sp.]|uniref:glutamine-hydrolyzing carbamoyl-phosphate synthase small subunit n=1 Tax=Immundisolibacter sp. TaxID=1934948 RepID=UPI003EE28544